MADQGVPRGAGVSAREAEVLAALGDHLTNAEISARLSISIRTVESHVSSLLRKLRAEDRRGALAWAAGEPRQRAEAYRLAIGLARLSFLRGLPGESQRRYEQAAGLAADDRAAADAFRGAAERPRRGTSETTRYACANGLSKRPCGRATGPAPRPTSPRTPS